MDIIDLDALGAAAAHLQREREDIAGRLTALGEYMRELTTSKYSTSTASASLQTSFDTFISQATQTIAALDDYRTHLDQVKLGYEDFDRSSRVS